MAFSHSPFAHERAPGSGVTAVLGPTNTWQDASGDRAMLAIPRRIGLPLRLLAREVYTRSSIAPAQTASR